MLTRNCERNLTIRCPPILELQTKLFVYFSCQQTSLTLCIDPKHRFLLLDTLTGMFGIRVGAELEKAANGSRLHANILAKISLF